MANRLELGLKERLSLTGLTEQELVERRAERLGQANRLFERWLNVAVLDPGQAHRRGTGPNRDLFLSPSMASSAFRQAGTDQEREAAWPLSGGFSSLVVHRSPDSSENLSIVKILSPTLHKPARNLRPVSVGSCKFLQISRLA